MCETMTEAEARAAKQMAAMPQERVIGRLGEVTAMVTGESRKSARVSVRREGDAPARQAETAGSPKGQGSIVESLMQGYALAKMTKSPEHNSCQREDEESLESETDEPPANAKPAQDPPS